VIVYVSVVGIRNVRKVNVSSSGRVWIDTDHFGCGKIINQVDKLNKWWLYYIKKIRDKRYIAIKCCF
jgi:hypothetical protein